VAHRNQAKSDKPSIKDAVFGNVGTMMSFKVGAEDAEYLEKEYAPTLSQQDIIGIANFTTYCKLNIDNASTRPFDIKTIWDNFYRNDRAAKIIKEYSRKMYARKKQYVDMEIEARLRHQQGRGCNWNTSNRFKYTTIKHIYLCHTFFATQKYFSSSQV
jgi:hypothetical protein